MSLPIMREIIGVLAGARRQEADEVELRIRLGKITRFTLYYFSKILIVRTIHQKHALMFH